MNVTARLHLLVFVAFASVLLAACGSSSLSEEDIKAAWQDWHDDHYGPDDLQEYQFAIGTSATVLWPNCVLVSAFDSGGTWMTLVMRDGEVVDVLPNHVAGRQEVAEEQGCT